MEGYEGHLEHLDGGYTVAFETYTADADLSPYFEGLPNNQCQAAHWGYVIEGKVKYSYGDREETFDIGDAYYVPQATRRPCTRAPRSSSSAPPTSSTGLWRSSPRTWRPPARDLDDVDQRPDGRIVGADRPVAALQRAAPLDRSHPD